MKKPALVLLPIAAIAAIALYFLAWPVAIDPAPWDAPVDRGLSGVFEVNAQLRRARSIDLGEHEGPEDVALGRGPRLPSPQARKPLSTSPSPPSSNPRVPRPAPSARPP